MGEYKQWRNENRTYLKDVIPLDTPYNMQIETSSLCNARCIYCAHSKPNHGVYEGNMSMDLLERIISDAKSFPRQMKVIEMFSFGEPLCNPNLAAMIKKVKQANISEKINFTTNALLLTPDKADELIEAGTDIIRISLQGLDAETYKNVCGVEVNFENFLSNLKYLYDHKCKCNIRMKIADVAISNSLNGKQRFEEIFGPLADSIFVEKIIPMFESVDYGSIDKTIYEQAINGRENVTQTTINKVCHRVFYRFKVAADGMVTAACCDTPNDICFGNIFQESLVDIWNGEKRKNFMLMQLEGKRFEHKICRKCMLPNDITTEADLLDPYVDKVIKNFEDYYDKNGFVVNKKNM